MPVSFHYEILIWLVATIALTLVLTEAIRRAGLIISIFIFAALPIGLAFLWPHIGLKPTGFEYAKVGSVCFGALFISLLRYRNWVQHSWARLIAYLILFINILEAMFTETFSNTYVNVAAGGLLLLSMALPHLMRVDENDKKKNLRYDLGLDWVLAYTLWDFTFIYGTGPPNEPLGEWSAFALAHLLVPLILMRGKAELYIQVRAYSLALLMMLAVTLPKEPFLMMVPDWHVPGIAVALRFASLVLSLFVLIRSVMKYSSEAGARNIFGALIGLFRR